MTLEGEFENSIVTDSAAPVLRVGRGGRLAGVLAAWAEKAQELQKQGHVFYFVFKHPKTPWYARLIAACVAGYLLSPIQIIPSYIPVIGFMDDLVVLVIGFKLIQKAIPPAVLRECRDQAEAAEVQRKNKSQIPDSVRYFHYNCGAVVRFCDRRQFANGKLLFPSQID